MKDGSNEDTIMAQQDMRNADYYVSFCTVTSYIAITTVNNLYTYQKNWPFAKVGYCYSHFKGFKVDV